MVTGALSYPVISRVSIGYSTTGCIVSLFHFLSQSREHGEFAVAHGESTASRDTMATALLTGGIHYTLDNLSTRKKEKIKEGKQQSLRVVAIDLQEQDTVCEM